MDALAIEQINELIQLAKREDVGPGDITSALLHEPERPSSFILLAKEVGVFAGREIAQLITLAYQSGIEIEWLTAAVDGTLLQEQPVELARLHGPVGAVLTLERVLLNFLQRLCGVATVTHAYVKQVDGTSATVFDTRKTIPGWRQLDRYAVRCGGGSNHRCGLYDAVLLKDNHLAGVPSARLAAHVFELLNRLDESATKPAFIEVEVDHLSQFEVLLDVVGIDVILLDNFSLDDLSQAVRLRDGRGLSDKLSLEASGGVTLDTVRQVADTGVDRISIGALTKSAHSLDLSLAAC